MVNQRGGRDQEVLDFTIQNENLLQQIKLVRLKKLNYKDQLKEGGKKIELKNHKL